MLKEVSLANASALLIAFYYIVCRLLASVAPDLLKTLGQSWFHTFDFSESQPAGLDLGTTVFGFSTAVGLSWISGYLLAFVYNKLSK